MSQAGANSTHGGGGGSGILTINSISPNGSGNFSINAGTNITITPGTNSITINSSSGSGIGTIDGDSGFVTGSTVTFTGGTTGLTFNGNDTTTMTLEGTLVVSDGGTGVDTYTPFAPIVAGTTSTGNLQQATTNFSTSGYVLTSTGSSSLPTWQAPSISNITWQDQGTNFTAATLHGYFIDGASQVMALLPATHNIGDTFILADIVGNGWQVVQGTANDQIIFGNRTTTLGTGGTLTSNSLGDVLQLVATSTTGTGGVWIAMLAQGNITVM